MPDVTIDHVVLLDLIAAAAKWRALHDPIDEDLFIAAEGLASARAEAVELTVTAVTTALSARTQPTTREEDTDDSIATAATIAITEL